MKQNSTILKHLNLPVFQTLRELSRLMNVDESHLRQLSSCPPKYYKRYRITKPNGKKREIRQPSASLKGIQAWILHNILDRLEPSSSAKAYRIGTSVRDNVRPHRDNRYFLLLDIEEFFHSVSASRVSRLFGEHGYGPQASELLARLCTCYHCLPQGGVTSPAISNLIAKRLDRRIAGYTERHDLSYTRYADDITISGNNPDELIGAAKLIPSIMRSEGFTPNRRKSRLVGPAQRCRITGLVRNDSDSTFTIGKYKRRTLRAALYNLLTDSTSMCAASRKEKAAELRGWLSYLKSVDTISHILLDDFRRHLIMNGKVTPDDNLMGLDKL